MTHKTQVITTHAFTCDRCQAQLNTHASDRMPIGWSEVKRRFSYKFPGVFHLCANCNEAFDNFILLRK